MMRVSSRKGNRRERRVDASSDIRRGCFCAAPPSRCRPAWSSRRSNKRSGCSGRIATGGGNSTRRVGIDYAQRQLAVFDEHAPGLFHGHVRTWDQLTQAMQSVLRRAGMVDGRGNIIVGN
jgi:hypothetical protein